MVMVIQVIHPTTHVMQYETKCIPSVITLPMHSQTLEKNATSYERLNFCYLGNCDRPLIFTYSHDSILSTLASSLLLTIGVTYT
jgi:hypothetical protein